MGRKPNALILQHFERGAKLPDSSNRYQHTCKACGEKFPKGRIDSLISHILSKCPAIPKQERIRARLELNNKMEANSQGNGQQGEVQMNGTTVDLPIVNNGWSALETLAEAARASNMTENHSQQEQATRGSGISDASRADRLELQEQFTLDNPPVSYEQRVQREKKMGNRKLNHRENDLSLSPAAFGHMSHSRSTSPNLAMAATSIAAAAARFMPSMVDPQLLGEETNGQLDMHAKSVEQHLSDANSSMQLPENFFSHVPGEQQTNWGMLDATGGPVYSDQEPIDHTEHAENTLGNPDPQQAGTYPRIAMNPPITTQFSTEFGNGQKNSKPKPRSRFLPERRKEVQTIRKIGACIRCRMLKKTCSPGDPCGTCSAVESARVWKQGCIRTRLADHLEMYAAGLHAVLAYHQVNLVKSQTHFQESTHQIEASHYPDTTIFVTVASQEGQQIPPGGSIDPGLSGDFSTNRVHIVNNGKDDLPTKVEAYMKRMLSVFIEREVSNFMKVTLNTAEGLSIQNHDALLTRVLELWATIHILVDHELTWKVSEKVDVDAQPGQGPTIDNNSNDGTYNTICLQLNAAAEKKAADLCKHVLGDLERRLLQKSSNHSFEIFLITLIVLNCLEKSAWLFNSWEHDAFKTRWPLDKTPQDYIRQVERVTDLLHDLLKIRHVPPEVYTREGDGILATDKNPTSQEYFRQLNLSYSEVYNKQKNPVFDQANSRCYELRFCSRLLLPQN